MIEKSKAASPPKAGRPEKTASRTASNLIFSQYFRQRIKRIIVWMAVWGLIPVWAAEWLIQHGGLAHD